MVDKSKNLNTTVRPPVVAILGHVDHGKTTLLDYIRKTNIAFKEAGGITQKIDAYQIDFKGEKITFIDTPGHATFEKMRSRGASVADIAILVIAADDGVKPQTIEAINHIKSANIPQIVAINKIDLPSANPAKVKKQLADHGVIVEGLGEKIPVVEISAKTGKNVTDLMDLILLVAELEELKGNKGAKLNAVVIESSLDKNKGPITTILVKDGSLNVGDSIIIENASGKIRSMIDSQGQSLSTATSSTPVEALGLKLVPPVGGIVRKEKELKIVAPKTNHLGAHNVLLKREEVKQNFKIIIKADNQGSLEAITHNLPQDTTVIDSATGDINDSDILLAKSSQAIIYGFNVKSLHQITNLAKSESVSVLIYDVIYKLLQDIEDRVTKFQQERIKKQVIGMAKIMAKFMINDQSIAGCKVVSGTISINNKVRVLRGEDVIGETRINSLKHKTKDISQAKKGVECGVGFSPPLDFQIGDSIELLAQNL